MANKETLDLCLKSFIIPGRDQREFNFCLRTCLFQRHTITNDKIGPAADQNYEYGIVQFLLHE